MDFVIDVPYILISIIVSSPRNIAGLSGALLSFDFLIVVCINSLLIM